MSECEEGLVSGHRRCITTETRPGRGFVKLRLNHQLAGFVDVVCLARNNAPFEIRLYLSDTFVEVYGI